MPNAIERDFAGGRFMFALSVPGILAVEGGPITPSLRKRAYPVSIFEIYDDLSDGIALTAEGLPVRLPRSRIFHGDLHNILEHGLKGGNSGSKDGDRFEVGAQMASQLVNDHIQADYEACMLLAWDILHATIKGVQLKKKAPEPAPTPRRTRRSTGGKS